MVLVNVKGGKAESNLARSEAMMDVVDMGARTFVDYF
jgi:hypothetical protein